jgi:hypothetical protein
MQIRVRKKDTENETNMDGKNIQSGLSEPGESTPIKYIPYPHEEKIEVYIREVIRVHIGDLPAVKHSFEMWAKQWD